MSHRTFGAALTIAICLGATGAKAETDAEKAAALKAAVETCDRVASVPLDPNAVAPQVHFFEMYGHADGFAGVESFADECATATEAYPDEERFKLQGLRLRVLAGTGDRSALAAEARAFAAAGSAEARFLLFRLYADDAEPGDDVSRSGVRREEGLRALVDAADAGHMEALEEYLTQLTEGPHLRRDPEAAYDVALKLMDLPRQGIEEEKPVEWVAKEGGRMRSAILPIVHDGFPEDIQRRGFAVLDELYDAGEHYLVAEYATAFRFGRGTDADPERAQTILEEALARGQEDARGPLADMIANGEAGPADGQAALDLLRAVPASQLRSDARVVLAGLYLDNRHTGRRPREAIRLLTANAGDLDAYVQAAGLMADYHEHPVLRDSVRRYLKGGAVNGEPEVARALAVLKLSYHPDFRDVDGARGLLALTADEGDRDAAVMLAALQYGDLTPSRMNPRRVFDDLSDEQIRQIIAEGLTRSQPIAYRVKGQLTRVGAIYPQDDVAASALLVEAAELGDVEAMVLAGDAYASGLGVDENPRARLRWWRRAALEGSIEAQAKLGSAFTFDFGDRLMNLREGITGRLVLYNNGAGRTSEMMTPALFINSHAQAAGVDELAAAVMDAWRIAPAGLDDAKLLPLMRAMPAEIRVQIERALLASGYIDGEPAGHFGPDVRAALSAWVDANGPLPDDYLYGDGVAVEQHPAMTTTVLPDDLILRAHERIAEAIRTAASPDDAAAAVIALNVLARYGDRDARWLVMRTYHTQSIVSDYVSPEEITRYAVDILVTRPADFEKVDFEFIFDVSKMYQRGEIGAFGPTLIDIVRDDPRLQVPMALGIVLQQAAFAPGACDSVRLASIESGMAGVGDGCDDATRAAIVAFAKERGPAGIEAAEREAAAAELLEMDRGG